MQVSLSPADKALIEARVRSGQFQTADELISRALHLLVEQEEELQREKSGIRTLLDERWLKASGPGNEWLDGEQVMAELEAEIDEYEKTDGAG
jgi:Arc/MetJ-type ribon-helix-helix transcriptional regulator